MNTTTFRDMLLSNPDFAVSYIVANNEVAVAERLRGMDFSVGNAEDIFQALNHLLQDGRLGEFQYALSVPMLTDGIDPAESAVVLEVGSGMARAVDAAAGEDAPVKIFDPTAGIPDIPDLPSGSNGAAAGSASRGSNTNWLNVFSHIAAGVSFTLGSISGGGNPAATVTQTATNANVAMEEAARAARTTRYFLIGLSAVGLLLLIWFIYKASK